MFRSLDINEIITNYRENKKNAKTNEKHNTVIKHTRMEKLIFNDTKNKIDLAYNDIDYTIDSIEKEGKKKLDSFPYLSQDLFNLFYKLNPTKREEGTLKDNVRRFNKSIIERVIDNPDYTSLKLLTESNDLESIEATREFIQELYNNLDDLLSDIGGDKSTLNNIEKSKRALESKHEQLETAINLYGDMNEKGKSKEEMKVAEKNVISLYMQVNGLNRKIEGLEKQIEVHSYQNIDKIKNNIDKALKQALNKIHEIKDTLDSFSGGEDSPQTIEGKTALINKVKNNKKFREMAKYIGRMKRLAKSYMNESFTKGIGRYVGIECGNDLSRILPSEYALLSTKETEVLFYKKFTEKKLLQFKQMSKKSKGRGHIIFIADESASIRGKEYWLKALAIALIDIALKEDRNFVYIPFGGRVGTVIEITKENYSEDMILKIANNFMSAGDTQFTPPITKAMEYLEKDIYENADVIFTTDGNSIIDYDVLSKFNEYRNNKKTKCVSILLDRGGYGNVSDVTVNKFSDYIFKTSELSEDGISHKIFSRII